MTTRKLVTGVCVGFVLVVLLVMWGVPVYHVWRKEMAGKANLKEAEWDRMILVREAEAKRDSATMLATAEVRRAKGVAEANAIIGESLKGNEAYLRYLWVIGLQDGSSETIYIPTEAGLPIMEATRRNGAE